MRLNQRKGKKKLSLDLIFTVAPWLPRADG